MHSCRARSRAQHVIAASAAIPESSLRRFAWLAVALATWLACAAGAEEPAASELDALRAEVAALRRDYETRIAELEARLAAAEAPEAPPAQPAAAAPAPAAASSAAAFNPAISVILQGRAAALDGPEGHRDIPGFLLGDESGVGPEGLSLGETELDLSANADDKFYGIATVALSDEDGETEVEVEEAYLQTLALPAGFTVKGGKFFSGVGYLNAKHSHAWDFVDQPLAYEAMLAGQRTDAGLQLRWVAPTDIYVELGGELLRGSGFPGGGSAHSGFGAFSLFTKLSGEVGASNTWLASASYLSDDPRGRASEDLAGNAFEFSGDSDLWIAALVWKWAPGGNFRARNLILQSEYLHRRERGALEANGASGRLRGDQDGVYAQATYQFVPRWRVGLRWDRLWSDVALLGLPPGLLDDGEAPSRASAMLDFSNSEFSRLRVQWNHQWGGLDGDDAVFLQYILSVGSHGAHEF